LITGWPSLVTPYALVPCFLRPLWQGIPVPSPFSFAPLRSRGFPRPKCQENCRTYAGRSKGRPSRDQIHQGYKKPKFYRKHSRFVPNELKMVQQGGFPTITWREPFNFPGFQHGGNRIAGAQRRRMRRGQESPLSEIHRKIRAEPSGMVGKPSCWTFTMEE
jgi:hypothetical protein